MIKVKNSAAHGLVLWRAILVSAMIIAPAWGQSSTTKCSTDMWGNTTCNSSADPSIDWSIIKPVPQPAPRPQTERLPPPVQYSEPQPFTPPPKSPAISSEYKPGSIGWLGEVCEKDFNGCLYFIAGSISAAQWHGMKFCPPKWVKFGDFPRIIMSYGKHNVVMQTDDPAYLLVGTALLAEMPCPQQSAAQPMATEK
jgi:hypothetical protein